MPSSTLIPVTGSQLSTLNSQPLIRLHRVTRRYSPTVAALHEVSLTIAEHECVAITGPSGCGKSTLLHLIGGLDTASEGEVHVAGLALHRASEAQLTQFRRRDLGIVFQFFHLLPTMTVFENVCMPLLLQGEAMRAIRPRADALLDLVGLTDRATHFLHQLSGGQMQRAAIARALIHEPKVLLADEPTGNLDSASAAHIIALLQKIASQRRTTLLVVTHSEEVAGLATRRIRLRDGRIA
jgi:putative ABC transport system ATP-binding protein